MPFLFPMRSSVLFFVPLALNHQSGVVSATALNSLIICSSLPRRWWFVENALVDAQVAKKNTLELMLHPHMHPSTVQVYSLVLFLNLAFIVKEWRAERERSVPLSQKHVTPTRKENACEESFWPTAVPILSFSHCAWYWSHTDWAELLNFALDEPLASLQP